MGPKLVRKAGEPQVSVETVRSARPLAELALELVRAGSGILATDAFPGDRARRFVQLQRRAQRGAPKSLMVRCSREGVLTPLRSLRGRRDSDPPMVMRLVALRRLAGGAYTPPQTRPARP